MALPFLPNKLNLGGTYDQIVGKLYVVFDRDLKHHTLRYKGRKIVFDSRKVGSEYEEGFWHIVTQGKKERLLDFKRAKRLPWLRPLVENCDDPALYKWIERDIDKKGSSVQKTYIWYREGRYLLVLKETPKCYFLTTAFYVTGPRNEAYYLSKFQRAQKKGPGC